MSEFSKNLRLLRLNEKLSQKELANILGYKYFTAISSYERGMSELSLDNLIK